jgi:hypothetical protein
MGAGQLLNQVAADGPRGSGDYYAHQRKFDGSKLAGLQDCICLSVWRLFEMAATVERAF